MPEFGPFGERSPEEIEHLSAAWNAIGSAGQTEFQFSRYIDDRGAEPSEDADYLAQRYYYVINDPDYGEAVRQEYEALLVAVEALAKYYAAQKKSYDVRSQSESDANSLIMAAHQIAEAEELTVESFLPGD
jgi:hypothetical protein